jgi:hypothetical protein
VYADGPERNVIIEDRLEKRVCAVKQEKAGWSFELLGIEGGLRWVEFEGEGV